MAAARLSPTASLLRNSRLFAVPAPIPVPAQAPSSQPIAESDTATKPYPTHATIETLPSSLTTGDWGLKRPLPLKSTTNTSNPVIRIKNGIDTSEHIVDFESASDHALTLQKWQELNLPVQIPQNEGLTSYRREENRSSFQPTIDNTKETGTLDRKRWRFQGPWLAGQSGLQFEYYVKTQIRRRKAEFMDRLRADLALRKATETKRKAMEAGQDVEESSGPVEVTDAELQDHIKALRANPADFGPLLHDFLDLPNGPERPVGDPHWSARPSYLARQSRAASTRYGNEGVPSTHPSAGLSYLHNATHVYNHPVFGPQSAPPPIEARVLASKGIRHSELNRALLGVAGFVARDSSAHSFRAPHEVSSGIADFLPKPGGAKVLVQPKHAAVDAQGRIHVEIAKAPNFQHRMYGKPSGTPPQLPDVVRGFESSSSSLPPLDDRYSGSSTAPGTGEQPLKSVDEVKEQLNQAFGGRSPILNNFP